MSHSMRNLLSTHLSPDFIPQTNDCFTGGNLESSDRQAHTQYTRYS